jgi:ATP-dependent DNA ligase
MGYEFRGFRELSQGIAGCLKALNAIIDGEICCLGKDGRSLFNALMFRRMLPHFYAFDLLRLDGEDLRQLPLSKRKSMLKKILPRCDAPVLFVSHVSGAFAGFRPHAIAKVQQISCPRLCHTIL